MHSYDVIPFSSIYFKKESINKHASWSSSLAGYDG